MQETVAFHLYRKSIPVIQSDQLAGLRLSVCDDLLSGRYRAYQGTWRGLWHSADDPPAPTPSTGFSFRSLGQAVVGVMHNRSRFEAVFLLARFVSVYFRSSNDIANVNVFQTPGDSNKEDHVRVTVRNRALDFGGSTDVSSTDFNNRDLPLPSQCRAKVSDLVDGAAWVGVLPPVNKMRANGRKLDGKGCDDDCSAQTAVCRHSHKKPI
jgi:hypothetical protein